MSKWDIDIKNMDYLNASGPPKVTTSLADGNTYKILIADDEEEVHQVTKMILKDFVFEGIGLTFLSAYTGEEVMDILKQQSDIALIFLDVVMEKSRSGLDVVEGIRHTLKNNLIRIILRTGQPGEAPEDEVIRKYDINDYRLKTELSARRLTTTVLNALRNYRDIRRFEQHHKGMEQIIQATSKMFRHNSLQDFLNSILEELSNFQKGPGSMVYMRAETIPSGVITLREGKRNIVAAATGKYQPYVGVNLENVLELSMVNRKLIEEEKNPLDRVIKLAGGILITSYSESMSANHIYIEGISEAFDIELIKLFLSNFSIALDNYVLNTMIASYQEEIVYTLAQTVESHFSETGNHVKRIADMMYQFALLLHFPEKEAHTVRLASIMHDLGKVGIPDKILKKEEKLTPEEFEVIKTHTSLGHEILIQSDLPVLKQAAEIALTHHERFDGSGYPQGLKGLCIPLTGRMLAIVDVYDAMTHERCYKQAYSREEALQYLEEQKQRHFDEQLVQVFIDHLDRILE